MSWSTGSTRSSSSVICFVIVDLHQLFVAHPHLVIACVLALLVALVTSSTDPFATLALLSTSPTLSLVGGMMRSPTPLVLLHH